MTRQITGFFISILAGILILSILAALFLCEGILFGRVLAADYRQCAESHTINVSIPEIVRLEVDNETILFDLSTVPNQVGAQHYYIPASPASVEIRVFSNIDREWQLKIKGLTSGALPVERVEWSIDGHNWVALRSREEVVTAGSFTKGWQRMKVYYRLLVTGQEYAGEYRLEVNYELTAL